jgi:4-diphosphocytidyl-2-C-methyl-D-erythritol kinase
VLGRRADGYHDLESAIVPIDLADRLEVHAASDPSFRTLSFSLEVEGDPDTTIGVPADETNLVLRAASALAGEAGVRGFADVRLDKRIPNAAGMGGGSADAAATLRALNDLWGIGLAEDGLRRLGAMVGSDVPALLAGGPVLVRGRGEAVERMAVPGADWVLVRVPFGVRTAQAFGWWDQDGAVTGADPAELLGLVGEEGGLLRAAPLLFNDLEGPVLRRHPQLDQVKHRLLDAGCPAAILCGSGATMAGLLPPQTPALDPGVEADLQAVAGRPVLYVRSLA